MDEPKELIKQTSFDIIRDNGNELLNNNEFFKDLSDIMEDEKFRVLPIASLLVFGNGPA